MGCESHMRYECHMGFEIHMEWEHVVAWGLGLCCVGMRCTNAQKKCFDFDFFIHFDQSQSNRSTRSPTQPCSMDI